MKKLTLLVMVLFSVNAFGASAVSRNGENIDQYNISDPGNVSGFDNYRVYYSHGIAEVVIQISGINTRTISESYYCQEDVDIVECPDDDIGGGVLRSPVLMFLEEIFSQNGVTQGAPITGASERMIYLAFWHEYRTKKLVTDSIAEMVLEGLNAVQQRRALKYIYFGNGVDIVTAQALANDRINNSVIARYDDYGFTNIPIQDRRLIKLFGLAGWFL